MVAIGRIACAVLAWIIGGAACSRSSDSDPKLQAPNLDGTQWIVSSMNGRPIISGTNVTLNFAADALGGYGGCNWYGSRYTITGNRIQILAPESTMRACLVPAGVGPQEEMYYGVLQQIAAYQVVDNRMEMMNDANEVVLVLSPRRRWAMNPADLIGTQWKLRSVNDTLRQADSLLTLNLKAGEISGFAGCRGYTGTYHARSDEIRITSLTMTDTECRRGQVALLREGQFTTDLSEASHYRISGDTLELITSPGRRLLFSRNEHTDSSGERR